MPTIVTILVLLGWLVSFFGLVCGGAGAYHFMMEDKMLPALFCIVGMIFCAVIILSIGW